jgi:hypothetical protein
MAIRHRTLLLLFLLLTLIVNVMKASNVCEDTSGPPEGWDGGDWATYRAAYCSTRAAIAAGRSAVRDRITYKEPLFSHAPAAADVPIADREEESE